MHFGAGEYHGAGDLRNSSERPRVFALRLETKNDPNTIRRLRSALKLLLRKFKFRCTDIREEV